MKGAIYIARTTSGRGSAVARAAWNTRTTDSLALDSILSVVAHRRTLPQHPRPLPLPVSSAVCSSNASSRCSSLLYSSSFSSFSPSHFYPSSYPRVLFTLFKNDSWFSLVQPFRHFLSRFPSFRRTVASETVKNADDIIAVFCRSFRSPPQFFFYRPPLLKTLRGVHSCRERHPT